MIIKLKSGQRIDTKTGEVLTSDQSEPCGTGLTAKETERRLRESAARDEKEKAWRKR